MSERQLAVSLRPSNFSEVIGNETIIKNIKDIIASKKLPTCFLLSGKTGTGKTTISRLIAKAINADLDEVNAADDTGVDRARALAIESQYSPLYGSKKAILLDECHQLTKQAQNALLKAIEEAADSTVWFLSTTAPSKLIEPLTDRCRHFRLEGLTQPKDVETLIKRALEASRSLIGTRKLDPSTLIAICISEGLKSPRKILNATERWIGGMDPLDAILETDSKLAIEIARGVSKGDWNSIKPLLLKATSEDATAIRIVTIGYLKKMLLSNVLTGTVPINMADSILELCNPLPFETNIHLAELCARLYNICN